MQARQEGRMHARIEVDELHKRVEQLETMTVSQLREEYDRVFDEPTASRNKRYLIKRIAYRLQELVHGGLSELARRRIEQLARNAPIRRRLLLLVPPISQKEGAPQSPQTIPPADNRPESENHPTVEPLSPPPPRPRDRRLPPPGTLLRKAFHENQYEVHVLDQGFELAGKRYGSLSGVARAITGTGWNGFLFFERELAQARGVES